MTNKAPRSLISSIFGMRCPRCRTGKMFETGSFSFKKPFDMHKECSHCKQNFWPEPGFYYGAMFISYIFIGWFCIFFAMFFHWVLGWSITASFGLLIAVCALLFVWFFRLARSIWIHFIVKYKP